MPSGVYSQMGQLDVSETKTKYIMRSTETCHARKGCYGTINRGHESGQGRGLQEKDFDLRSEGEELRLAAHGEGREYLGPRKSRYKGSEPRARETPSKNRK